MLMLKLTQLACSGKSYLVFTTLTIVPKSIITLNCELS